MKRVTLDIKEEQYKTFMSFLKTLDYVSVSSENEEIPEWHKEILDQRLREASKTEYKSWSEVKSSIKFS